MYKKIKKILVSCFIISLVGITSVFAAVGIKSAIYTDSKIYLGNKQIPLSDSLASITKDGETSALTYVPVRDFFEKTGYNVEWDGSDNSIHLSQKVISTFEELRSQTFPLIADYEEVAFLYGIDTNSSKGVVLQYAGVSKAFDWVFTTPRLILPRMQVFDYENTGTKQAAISVNVASGTGLGIDELHIVKAVDGDLIDKQFMTEDYLKQIADKISYTVSKDNDKVLIKIEADKNSLTCDITEYVKEASAKESDVELAYGSIIEFTPKEDGRIELTAGLGVHTDKRFDPMYIAYIKADVTYRNGVFILSDMQLSDW